MQAYRCKQYMSHIGLRRVHQHAKRLEQLAFATGLLLLLLLLLLQQHAAALTAFLFLTPGNSIFILLKT
jgi:hypothetical protein